jgi:hypothetical protein
MVSPDNPEQFLNEAISKIHCAFADSLKMIIDNLAVAYKDDILTEEQKEIWYKATLYTLCRLFKYQGFDSEFEITATKILYETYAQCKLNHSVSKYSSHEKYIYMLNKYNDGFYLTHKALAKTIQNLKSDLCYLEHVVKSPLYPVFDYKHFLDQQLVFAIKQSFTAFADGTELGDIPDESLNLSGLTKSSTFTQFNADFETSEDAVD